MIRVVISCGEEDMLLKLPLSSTASQLKTRWADTYSDDIQDLRLSVKGHNDLHDDTCINDIVQDPVDILHMTLEKAAKVEFSLLSSDAAPLRFSVFLSAPLSAQLPRIKERLEIEASRPVRLSLNGAALRPDLSLAAQQVVENSKVEVLLGWRVHLKQAWTREEDLQSVSCFKGDLVRPTLTSNFTGDFQLFHQGKPLDFDATIDIALGIFTSESHIDYTVELRIPRQLSVMDTTGIREVSVFDGITVGELDLSCCGALMCGQEVVSVVKRLEGDGNMLLQADLCVVLVLSHETPTERRRHVVRLPGRASVYDLWCKAMKIEETRHINLYFRGRRLDDFFTELRALGIESGSTVSIQKDPPLAIKMRTSCGKHATFSLPEVRSVTYSDLMRLHKAQDERKDPSWAFLKGLAFRCNGCGRMISREMDGRQLVPAPCCDTASTDLTAVHHSADKGMQTFETNRQQSVALDTQFDLEHGRDAASQTEVLTKEASIQFSLQGENAASQTELLTKETSNQFSLHERNQIVPFPSPSIIRFRIIRARGTMSFWNIECSPTDSLTDLLGGLAKRANCNVNDFTLIYQFEAGIIDNNRLRYHVLGSKQTATKKGEMEWNDVFGSHGGCADDKTVSRIAATNYQVTGRDDIFFWPGSFPLICINIRSSFLEMSSDSIRIPKTTEALLDPKYVAWIRLVRLVDTRGEMPPEMLLGSETKFVNVSSGQIFRNRQAAVHGSRIPLRNQQDEYCNLLLRHNSALPKWPIAADVEPWIFIRDGSDFAVERGIIKVKKTMLNVLSKRWVFPLCPPNDRIPPDSKLHLLSAQIVQFISS